MGTTLFYSIRCTPSGPLPRGARNFWACTPPSPQYFEHSDRRAPPLEPLIKLRAPPPPSPPSRAARLGGGVAVVSDSSPSSSLPTGKARPVRMSTAESFVSRSRVGSLPLAGDKAGLRRLDSPPRFDEAHDHDAVVDACRVVLDGPTLAAMTQPASLAPSSHCRAVPPAERRRSRGRGLFERNAQKVFADLIDEPR